MRLPTHWRSALSDNPDLRDGSLADIGNALPSATGDLARRALWLFFLSAALVFTIGAYTQLRIDIGLGVAITEIFLIGLPAFIFLRRHPSLMSGATFARPRVLRALRLSFVGVFASIGGVVLGTLVRRVLGLSAESLAIDPTVRSATIVVLMFSLCVLAPLCEELLFRVVIQGALSRAVPMGFAVLGTGALFAVYHGSLERVPEVLVLGLFLGVLYRRTGSYWQCVLLHFVLNTVGPPLFVIASQVSTPILIGVIPVAILIGIAALPRAANSGAAGDAAPASAIPRARSSRGIAVAILALVLASLGIETTLYATGALNRFDTSAFPSPGWCVQEWRLGSKGMFTVTERLTLRASEVPPSAIAPVATGAELVSAVVDGQPIVSERLSDTWMLQPGESENARRCVLVWTVPIASLKEEFGAYWVESRTPVAVCGFRVELVLEPGCGFEDAREPARRKEPVLFMNTGSEQCFSSLPRVGLQVKPAASFHIEGRTTR